MRYPLLLMELLNSTPESHPDKVPLTSAVLAVKEINVNINEYKRRKDLGKKSILAEKEVCPWPCCLPQKNYSFTRDGQGRGCRNGGRMGGNGLWKSKQEHKLQLWNTGSKAPVIELVAMSLSKGYREWLIQARVSTFSTHGRPAFSTLRLVFLHLDLDVLLHPLRLGLLFFQETPVCPVSGSYDASLAWAPPPVLCS